MTMNEEPVPQVQVPGDSSNPEEAWEHLSAGLKARAMRTVYEDQQKLVIELQRQLMETGAEYAVGVVHARAAQEMQQEALLQEIVDTEVLPKHKEIEALDKRLTHERQVLEVYTKIGKGIL